MAAIDDLRAAVTEAIAQAKAHQGDTVALAAERAAHAETKKLLDEANATLAAHEDQMKQMRDQLASV